MEPELIAITLGSDGALAATTDGKNRSGDLQQRRLIQQEPEIDSGWIPEPVFIPNKAIDEMDWHDLRACARQGNAVACLCVQKKSGIPAIPKKREVMEFLNQHIKK